MKGNFGKNHPLRLKRLDQAQILFDRPMGASMREIEAHLGLSERQASCMLSRAARDGEVFRAGCPKLARYFRTAQAAKAGWPLIEAETKRVAALNREARKVAARAAYVHKPRVKRTDTKKAIEARERAIRMTERAKAVKSPRVITRAMRPAMPPSKPERRTETTEWKKAVPDFKRGKVTICPSGRDTRYTPSADYPRLFSTMGIGRYLDGVRA